MKKLLVLLMIPLLASCSAKGPAGPAGNTGKNAATVIFQNGAGPSVDYAGCNDSVLDNLYPADNTGACDHLYAGTGVGGQVWRTVIKFDVSYIIPVNVTVTSAVLEITLDGTPADAGLNTYTAFSIGQSWVEGTGACSPSGNTDVNVSWNNYNGSGSTWTGGGYFLPDTVSNSIVVNYVAALKVQRFVLAPALVQSWLADPSQNNGIIIVGNNESGIEDDWISFCSSQFATIASRPKLTITYRLP